MSCEGGCYLHPSQRDRVTADRVSAPPRCLQAAVLLLQAAFQQQNTSNTETRELFFWAPWQHVTSFSSSGPLDGGSGGGMEEGGRAGGGGVRWRRPMPTRLPDGGRSPGRSESREAAGSAELNRPSKHTAGRDPGNVIFHDDSIIPRAARTRTPAANGSIRHPPQPSPSSTPQPCSTSPRHPYEGSCFADTPAIHYGPPGTTPHPQSGGAATQTLAESAAGSGMHTQCTISQVT